MNNKDMNMKHNADRAKQFSISLYESHIIWICKQKTLTGVKSVSQVVQDMIEKAMKETV